MPDSGPTTDQSTITLTKEAIDFVTEARASEEGAERLALFLEINGVANGSFTYDMWFELVSDASPGDVVSREGDLDLVIMANSVDRVRGATLDVGDAGLFIVNPNAPVQAGTGFEVPESDLSKPIEIAVLEILEDQINPQIALHGGRADLVAIDDENVCYLRLSGGCQGCGLAQVTLRQGIMVAIQEALPEITDVIDVTSHAEGTDPYFEAAKK